jgi:hypothetical protein
VCDWSCEGTSCRQRVLPDTHALHFPQRTRSAKPRNDSPYGSQSRCTYAHARLLLLCAMTAVRGSALMASVALSGWRRRDRMEALARLTLSLPQPFGTRGAQKRGDTGVRHIRPSLRSTLRGGVAQRPGQVRAFACLVPKQALLFPQLLCDCRATAGLRYLPPTRGHLHVRGVRPRVDVL